MRTFLLALAIVAVVAGCGGGGHSASPAGTTTATTTAPPATTTTAAAAPSTSAATTTAASGTGKVVLHGRYRYPPILIRNYMKSCVGAAGGGVKKRNYCACTLDKLSFNVSTRDFAEIGLSHGRIPPRIKRFMSAAIADCANKL